ncbi:MAG: WG repeat-containing protein, partial [Bacteroidales bacterium]|nr:WG repeat-containing protein [Bacteroidales bacterium]
MSYKCILASVVMVLALSFPAEAQFLEKLTKGLEKVNKGLDNVNKVLNFDETLKKQSKKSEKNTSSKKGSQSQTSTEQTSSVDVSGWKKAEPTYPTPYISSETKFMVAEPYEHSLSDVHDGVFAVKQGNAFEFWKVTGEKLFDAEWKYAGGEIGANFPIFSNGVAAARRTQPNASGKTPIYLLYLDGRIKELDPSWETVSQFMDGVALVTKQVNYREQAFYIDIAGNRLYPNLKVEKGRGKPMRPLRDGMRAYCNIGGNPAGYVWGFIDDKGNVKIAPRYKEVTDFANGYAWGSTSDNRTGYFAKELIDVTGKVVFSLNLDYTTTDVSKNGVFCVVKNDRNVYYNLEGKELASYRSGSGFYNGYAFIAQGYEDAEVIDRNFNIVKRMPYSYCNAVDVSSQSPNFKPYGLATVQSGTTVMAPNGQIVLTSYENHKDTAFGGFRQFSESGYMKAVSCLINGKQCAALIKSSGEVAWVFS